LELCLLLSIVNGCGGAALHVIFEQYDGLYDDILCGASKINKHDCAAAITSNCAIVGVLHDSDDTIVSDIAPANSGAKYSVNSLHNAVGVFVCGDIFIGSFINGADVEVVCGIVGSVIARDGTVGAISISVGACVGSIGGRGLGACVGAVCVFVGSGGTRR
jgi:hypothetical protein